MATVSKTFSVRNGLDVANTIVLDANRNISNISTANASTVNATSFFTSAGLNVTDQANNAYAAANSAANTVRVSANGGSTLSNKQLNFTNSASVQVSVTDGGDGNANIVFTTTGAAVGDAYAQANTARGTANDAYAQANTARGTANDAYSQANAAYGQANGAYVLANDAYSQANTAANTVRVSSNGGGTLSNKQLNFVNTSTALITIADGGNGNANISISVVGGGAIGQSYDQANAAYGQANAAYDSANAAACTAAIAYSQANNAYNQANAAYAEANLKLNLTGGTINGSLNVSGNLTVTGNTSYINVSTLNVTDPIIFLAANNDTSDVVDIGFIGAKNTGSGVTHTGLVRDAGDGTYYLFDNLADGGHQNNVIDFANSTLAILRANISANSILLTGNAVATQANLTIANDQANTARNTANDAYSQANTARNTANAAYAAANSAANTVGGTANDAYGQANAAYSQANAAYAEANTKVSKSGDTMTGKLTINTSGEGLQVANANVTSYLTVGSLNVYTNTVTTSTAGQVVLDTFAVTAHASAKYFVQANNGTDYTVTEMIIVQDGTNIFLTEYGTIQSGPSLGIFSADINSGNARLLFTANNNVNTIRSVRYGVLVP